MQGSRWAVWAAVGLALLGVLRIALSYRERPQGYDEPGHIAAALQWIDQGTYTIDPMHPPLGRIAMGVPLYLAGERYPKLPPEDPSSSSYTAVGNAVLYGDHHYLRNLELARSGVLPFFLIGAAVVFFWTRRHFGAFAAVMAVALFTTLPNVLAFSGLAYTDMCAAVMQAMCFFAFSVWLEKPTRRATVVLGIAVGLALLSKFTSLMFVPAAAAALVACKWIVTRGEKSWREVMTQRWLLKLTVVAVIAVGMLWGGYRFSIGHVQEDMQLSPANMPSFQHFPAPLRNTARAMVVHDVAVPAPALLRGVAGAWVLDKTPAESYLLGQIKTGGWWYFFLVGIAVKSPIPFLILCFAGVWVAVGSAREGKWQSLTPTICALAILMVTMPVKYNAGVRHVLVVFPLLAIVAGSGCAWLWRLRWRGAGIGRPLLVAMLLWQAVSSFHARHDYVAYFNAFAGSDPSRVLLIGCDLDCGQDLYRLAADLRARRVSEVKIAVWSNADLSQLGLPKFEVLAPFQPATGWVAVSMRSLRFGDVFRKSYPPNALAWLNRYQPVEEIGETIRLYHIPEDDSAGHVAASAGSR